MVVVELSLTLMLWIHLVGLAVFYMICRDLVVCDEPAIGLRDCGNKTTIFFRGLKSVTMYNNVLVRIVIDCKQKTTAWFLAKHTFINKQVLQKKLCKIPKHICFMDKNLFVSLKSGKIKKAYYKDAPTSFFKKLHENSIRSHMCTINIYAYKRRHIHTLFSTTNDSVAHNATLAFGHEHVWRLFVFSQMYNPCRPAAYKVVLTHVYIDCPLY